ncbi:hypothetical protein MUP77_15515 [Candidatus Bathyarchaeota archaeon]|nr:hypothetical protein [Candidatus Bathyarchaeota archaeon]
MKKNARENIEKLAKDEVTQLFDEVFNVPQFLVKEKQERLLPCMAWLILEGTRIDNLLNLIDIPDIKLSAPVEETKNLRLQQYLYAMQYLSLVEAFGSLYINFFIYLKIFTGHELHLGPDPRNMFIRHAKTMEDIESPYFPLSNKLAFLKMNKVTFASKLINDNRINLRNKIAHFQFDIDGEGNFYKLSDNPDNEREKVDIKQTRDDFRADLSVVYGIIEDNFKKAVERFQGLKTDLNEILEYKKMLEDSGFKF